MAWTNYTKQEIYKSKRFKNGDINSLKPSSKSLGFCYFTLSQFLST